MAIELTPGPLTRQTSTWLQDNFAAERARWVLWLPVALGTGIGVYFALPFEPSQVVGIAGLAFTVGLLEVFRHIWPVRLVLLAVLGFVAAQWRTQQVSATVLDRTLAFTTVDGQVRTVEPSGKRSRVVMAVHAISGPEPVKMPIFLCLRLHVADADIRSGDVIRVRARLAPPPTASYPDGFDFSRQAWFSGLGLWDLHSDRWSYSNPTTKRR